MTHELLDQLLLDRALGALSPEVDALLAAYIATNPDLAKRASEYSATVDSARDVLCGDAGLATALPSFPRPRIESALRAARVRRLSLHAVSLAACVLFGFGIANWRSATQGPPRHPQAAASARINWFDPSSPESEKIPPVLASVMKLDLPATQRPLASGSNGTKQMIEQVLSQKSKGASK